MNDERAILHVDMDAFYASVEQRDCPELRGKAVIVGGLGRRGVVAAASYEARGFGVRSAMPVARARALCPEGVYLHPRMAHYRSVASTLFALLERYTPLVEPLSLDEAFMDVTASCALFGEAKEIAGSVKQAILKEMGLVASIGLASNKFVAKLASDIDKPNGLRVVESAKLGEFLDPLPVRRIWGIGAKAVISLQRIGVHSVAELRCTPAAKLTPILGQRVAHFLALARGEDARPVRVDGVDRSVSNEVTFSDDRHTEAACLEILLRLSGQVAKRLRAKGLRAKTVSVKIRTARFETISRQRTLPQAICDDRNLYRISARLFSDWWRTRQATAIRLLGVRTSGFSQYGHPDLFVADEGGELDRVADRIRHRFGQAAIGPATLLPRTRRR